MPPACKTCKTDAAHHKEGAQPKARCDWSLGCDASICELWHMRRSEPWADDPCPSASPPASSAFQMIVFSVLCSEWYLAAMWRQGEYAATHRINSALTVRLKKYVDAWLAQPRLIFTCFSTLTHKLQSIAWLCSHHPLAVFPMFMLIELAHID